MKVVKAKKTKLLGKARVMRTREKLLLNSIGVFGLRLLEKENRDLRKLVW